MQILLKFYVVRNKERKKKKFIYKFSKSEIR